MLMLNLNHWFWFHYFVASILQSLPFASTQLLYPSSLTVSYRYGLFVDNLIWYPVWRCSYIYFFQPYPSHYCFFFSTEPLSQRVIVQTNIHKERWMAHFLRHHQHNHSLLSYLSLFALITFPANQILGLPSPFLAKSSSFNCQGYWAELINLPRTILVLTVTWGLKGTIKLDKFQNINIEHEQTK